MAGPDDTVCGLILADRQDADGLSASRLAVAAALAAHLGSAVHRTELDQRLVTGVEFARSLLAVPGIEPASDDTLLSRIDRTIPSSVGFAVVGMRLAGGRCMAQPGSSIGSDAEASLWRSWSQRRRRPAVHHTDGLAYVPIWAGGRTIGLLEVRPARGRLPAHEYELVEALADAIGESTERHVLRQTAERRERELALADERHEVAAELHADLQHVLELLHQGLVGAAAAASTDREQVTRLVELDNVVRLGQAGLGLTIRSLEGLRYHPLGLPSTLAAMVSRFAEQMDVAADLMLRGEVRPLSLPIEQALLRAAHEVLSRVQARGRATAMAVRLEYCEDAVKLVVRDDGVGLAAREEGAPALSLHTGLRTIRQRLEALGGSLDVQRCQPRGLLLTLVVPTC
jgi:signal transduction histidine kinase